MNEKNLPDDINSKTLDELTQEAQKLINKLEKEEKTYKKIINPNCVIFPY